MLNVGIDYYRTITNNPRMFRRLAQSIMDAGYQVHIITAVKADRVAIVKDEVKRSKVPHTSLEVVVFDNFEDIPKLKLEACKRVGVRLHLDDMPLVCKLLKENGIQSAQIY